MKRAAVLGSPIKHSLSPTIHNAAYQKLGVVASYEAHEIDSANLTSFLTEHLKEQEWNCFSLTMPLKEKICEIAKDLDLVLDSQSLRISSANTLYRQDGRWKGTSTDVTGFSFLLKPYSFDEVTIIGAGGTARAALEALDDKCLVKIVRRDEGREKKIRDAFPYRAITFIDWRDVEKAWSSPLVVLAIPIDAETKLVPSFTPPDVLLDAVYSPWLPPLSKLQIDSGKELISGVELLCAQALDQIRLMTSATFDSHDLFDFLKTTAERALTK